MKLNFRVVLATVISVILIVLLAVSLFPALFVSNQSGDLPFAAYIANVNNPPEPAVTVKPDGINPYEIAVKSILENSENFKVSLSDELNAATIDDICSIVGEDKVADLASALAEGEVDSEKLHEVVGYTEKALKLLINDDLYRTEVIEDVGESAEVVFVGDVAFCDNWSLMHYYVARGKGVEGVVSNRVLEIMRNADITMANNEFVLSNGGTAIPGKKFCIRGKPENVNIYHEMGVDIVGMANNHAFDFNAAGLTDTLATLDAAGIAHLGAGENRDEAGEPYYYIIGGRVLGITAGSVIDPWTTRNATDTLSGVFQVLDTDSMCEVIKEAKERADIVVNYMHWGIENTTNLTDGQKRMGKAFVDAGADIVLGMHSHCMQGCEYYKGKLIAYSLGNFTFSGYTLTAAMVKMAINADGTLENTFYPLMHNANYTIINDGEAGASQLNLLKRLLINAEISDDFIITPTEKGAAE